MSFFTRLRPLVLSCLLLMLPACSTIKSWFPDKERDYQFTTEIPELIIPEDLRNSSGLSPMAPAQKVAASTTAETTSDASVVADVSAVGQEKIEVDAPYHAPSQGVSSLHIDQPRKQASRLVGKAMTRKKLEIVERNIDDGYFYIKYDPNAVKFTDDSIFDEIKFIFGDDPVQEEEYRVVVKQIGPEQSEVTIEDSSGQVLSNNVANNLLKMITEGISQVNEPEPETDGDKASDADQKPNEAEVTEPGAASQAPSAPDSQIAPPKPESGEVPAEQPVNRESQP